MSEEKNNEEMENSVALTSQGPIEYSIVGQGQPVLFFHGGHSNSKETLFHKGWDQNKYQLITPSRPGYGETPLGDNNTASASAALVHSLCEQLGVKDAILVGISAGGPTVINFASNYPEMSKALILISAVSGQWLESEDALYKNAQRIFAPKMEKISWLMFRNFFRLAPHKMTKTLFSELSTVPNPDITKPEILEVRSMTFRQSSGSGFLSDIEHRLEDGILSRIQCKSLILHSENDKSVPVEIALNADKQMRHSVLKTYDNKWGHLLWLGDDSKFPIQELNNFLDTLE